MRPLAVLLPLVAAALAGAAIPGAQAGLPVCTPGVGVPDHAISAQCGYECPVSFILEVVCILYPLGDCEVQDGQAVGEWAVEVSIEVAGPNDQLAGAVYCGETMIAACPEPAVGPGGTCADAGTPEEGMGECWLGYNDDPEDDFSFSDWVYDHVCTDPPLAGAVFDARP